MKREHVSLPAIEEVIFQMPTVHPVLNIPCPRNEHDLLLEKMFYGSVTRTHGNSQLIKNASNQALVEALVLLVDASSKGRGAILL